MHKNKLNTWRQSENQEFECICLRQISKWQKYFQEHFLFYFNAKSDTSCQYEKQILVTYYLSFDAATLSHCIIACSLSSPKSEASTAIWSRHGWHLASVTLTDSYAVKFSKRRTKKGRKKQSVEIWVWGCFVSPGFEQMESTFLLDSLSFLMLSSFLTTYVWH